MQCKMLEPAKRIGRQLEGSTSGKLPLEILCLDENTASIIVDVDGVDYILTVVEVPNQRPRPTSN